MPFSILMLFVIILSVLLTQIGKKFFTNSQSVGTATVLAQFFASLGALIWVWAFPLELSMPKHLWGLLLVACIFYALNDRLSAELQKNLEISILSLIGKTSDVFLIIIGAIFFNQIPSIMKIISAVLIIIAQVALFYESKTKKFTFNKYLLLALLKNFLFAIAISIDIGISNEINLPIYVAITLSLPLLMIILWEKISLEKISTEFKHANKTDLILFGLIWGSFIVTTLTAYQYDNIITVIIIGALAVVINVGIGIFCKHERDNLAIKLFALIVLISSIMLSAFAK